ncbi:hypothetical protein [Xenorhabdus budapestensis]|uniref:Uncharacterized protein n=1 Tax=Xenorhabdus budapestensis TaxID=290110 RepID=A0A2D0IPC9_XENBU|nr:hypothetical protein [Xenorhabdus budapestensis]PHM23727.1 hypothetical protein Xbud_03498 [Xenorhabdus budapestensis]
MQKKEPVIIANGNSIEEIYQWMENKLEARRDVVTLARQVEYINKEREKTNKQFNDAVNQSQLNISKQDYERETNNNPLIELERERWELIRQLGWSYPKVDERDYESPVRDCNDCCRFPSSLSQEKG